MDAKGLQTWDLWYPSAAATGLPFARGRLKATDRVLVHAAPDVLSVEVRDAAGARQAFGDNLARTQESPICLLTVSDTGVTREDVWPTQQHLDLPVLLAGGEAGLLRSWWNADDRKEWRWQIELYNSLR